jgi:hypothetical protein
MPDRAAVPTAWLAVSLSIADRGRKNRVRKGRGVAASALLLGSFMPDLERRVLACHRDRPQESVKQ